MIVTRIEALGFRSLRYVSQRLDPFHVLVGPNASGKSTFLDVLAFLGDLQRVDLRQAITGNAPLGIPLRATDPQHLTWMRRGKSFELAVEMAVPEGLRERLAHGLAGVGRYELAVDVSEPLRIATETLWLKPDSDTGPEPDKADFPNPPEPPARIVTDPAKRAPSGWRKVLSRGSQPERVTFRSETSARSMRFHIPADRSALANLPQDEELFPGRNPFPADARRRRAAHRAMERRHASSKPPQPFRRLSARRLESAACHRRGRDREPRSVRGLDMARPRGAAGRRAHYGHSGVRKTGIATWSSTTATDSKRLPGSSRTARYGSSRSRCSHTSPIQAVPISSRSLRMVSIPATWRLSWTRFPRSAMPRFSWRPIPQPLPAWPGSIRCCASRATTRAARTSSSARPTPACGTGRVSWIWVCCSRAGFSDDGPRMRRGRQTDQGDDRGITATTPRARHSRHRGGSSTASEP